MLKYVDFLRQSDRVSMDCCVSTRKPQDEGAVKTTPACGRIGEAAHLVHGDAFLIAGEMSSFAAFVTDEEQAQPESLKRLGLVSVIEFGAAVAAPGKPNGASFSQISPSARKISRERVVVRRRIPHLGKELLHPYVSFTPVAAARLNALFASGRQTIGGTSTVRFGLKNVADEMAYMKKLFPRCGNSFFDDDTSPRIFSRSRDCEEARAVGFKPELQQPRQSRLRHHQSFKDSGLRLFLVGYESGNDDILTRIKKGVTMDEMRRFTKSCHQAGVVIHGTFILGLPVETQQSIENTIRFAQELDVFSIQVSLAAPYPGTRALRNGPPNGWFVKKDKNRSRRAGRFQQSALEYPGLSKDKIFERSGPFLSSLLPPAQTDPAHHQDHARRQKTSSSAAARRLRILQEPPSAQVDLAVSEAARRLPPRSKAVPVIFEPENWSHITTN